MLSGLLFSWVTPLVRRGAAEPLNYDDLLPTPHDTTPKASTGVLWRHWTQTCATGRPSLLRAIMGAYGGPYYRLALLKLLNDSLTFAGTMLLNLLVQHLEHAQAATAAAGGSSGGSSSSACGSSGVIGVLLPAWCPPGSACWGYLLAGLLGGSVVVKAVVGSHYNYGLNRVTIRLRAGVMGVLFRASLLSRTADATAACAGDINTLMAVDAGRLANLALSVQELWSLPLQILAAMTLLYMQVRTAFIAGVLLCIALIPINRLIAQRIQAASVSMMSAKDARVSLMGELLRHLAIVKAMGWEEVLGEKVLHHRRDELRALAVRKYLDALCVYFWAATQLLLSGTTFGLMVLLGQPLRPSVVFTSLALFNVLIAPLNAFPWVVNGVVEALVSLRRIQTYLLLPQRCPDWAYTPAQLPSVLAAQQQQQAVAAGSSGSKEGEGGCCGRGKARKPDRGQQQQQLGNCVWVSAVGPKGVAQVPPHALDSFAAVQFCDASFAWKKGSVPCLSELRLSIPAGCLTAVVGEVGSGKSSLLSAILGELNLVGGHALLPAHGLIQQQQQQQQGQSQSQSQQQQQQSVSVRVRRIGYVGQSSWLMRGSVRDNVLLGQSYDAELMGEIYHAVGLDTDLAAMPAGDLTPVGEGGSGLSGGQRLRVSLARALYQPGTNLFLLDDVLASLDSHVAQWIIRHTLFGGLLTGATVVVVTKHPAVIQSAQLVVALQLGRAVFTGSPSAYANWKARQSAQQHHNAGAGNGWTPIVRHTSSSHVQSRHLQLTATTPQQPQQQEQEQQSAATASSSSRSPSSPPGLHIQCEVHAPHPALADMLSPTSPNSPGDPLAAAAAVGGTTAAAAAAEISLESEDVPVSELLLAGGHGVWAPHASLAPQLNAISEEGGSSCALESAGSTGSSGVLLDGYGSSDGSSGGSNGGSSGSWEVVQSPGSRARNAALQQQQQELLSTVSGDDGRFGNDSAAAAAARGATAAAAAADRVDEPQQGSRGVSRRVSFSHDVIAADEDKQQQQQQQAQHVRTHHQQPQQDEQPPSPPQQQQQQQQQQHQQPPPSPPPPPPQQQQQQPEDGDGSSGGCVGDSEESRAVGAVGWGVYASYFKAVGVVMCCAVLGSLLAMQASKNGVDLWVTSSLSHNTSVTDSNYSSSSSGSSFLGIYHLYSNSSSSSSRRGAAGETPASSGFMSSVTRITSYGSLLMSSSVTASLASAGGPTAVAQSAAAATAGFQALSFAAAAAASSSVGMFCTAQNVISSSSRSSSDRLDPPHLFGQAWQPKQQTDMLLQQQWQRRRQDQGTAPAVPKPSRKLLLQQLLDPPSIPSADAAKPQLDNSFRRNSSTQNPGPKPVGDPPKPRLRWQPAPLDPDMIRFLKGLVIISSINTLATLARAFTFAAAGMAAAKAVHRRLLGAVLAAPLAAFDTQPAGRLLNRFSSDTSVVDDSLPFILNILLANAVSLVGLLAVLLYSQPLLGLVLLPLAVVYRRLQLFYRSSARELRRLEAVGLSPLYTLYSDTAAGADTVRAAAAQGVFMQRFLQGMCPYQSACVNNAAASNWLSMRLQLLAAVLLSAVAVLAAVVAAMTMADSTTAAAAGGADTLSSVALPGPFTPWAFSSRSSSSGSSGGGYSGSNGSSWIGGTFRIDLLGLALAYCLPIVNLLNGLLTSSAETEQDMVAVERIAALLDSLPQQQQQQGRGRQRQQRRRLPASSRETGLQEPLLQQYQQQQEQQERGRTLTRGPPAAAVGQPPAAAAAVPALEIVDVVMRYRPGLPPALRGVSLTVPVGHKLGVCGRTGAGKSSLLSVLLRLRPIESGVIRVLGSDAEALTLRELRSHFAVVPQQPVLFYGTLRDNLDPYGRLTDEQLAATLQAVHMWAPLCRIALHKKLLGHSTYLMARRAGSLVEPGYQGTSGAVNARGRQQQSQQQSQQLQQRSDGNAAAAIHAVAAAAATGATAVGRGLQRSSSQQQQQQGGDTGEQSAAAADGSVQSMPSTDLHEDEVAAIAAAWSTRRRATPFAEEARFPAADGAAGGIEISLDSQLLEEGGALAVGAAAGATSAVIERDARRRSQSASRKSSLKRVLAAAAAVVGSPNLSKPLADLADLLPGVARRSSEGGPRRRSEAESVVLPPVPMHPADKVLSMQVGGPSGLSLSSGQAQLVCVARCLLAGAPLVLLDEATAAVDPKTAGLLHQVLHEQFDTLTSHILAGSSSISSSNRGSNAQHGSSSSSSSGAQQHNHHHLHRHRYDHHPHQQRRHHQQQQQQWWWQQVPIRPTVIQIAHELSAIMSYDTVAVMSGGQVVEMGNPQQLAAQEGSKFSRLRAQEGH